MAKKQLSEEFKVKAPPAPVMDAEIYRLTLEYLLAQGKGYGKTAPVAAYLLRNLSIVKGSSHEAQKNNKNKDRQAAAQNKINREDIIVENRYLIMDPKEWPNEYGRSLGVRDIAAQWALRVVEEKDLNSADYLGPGIWTCKQSSFDEDYIRKNDIIEVDGKKKRTSIYDPNPDAHRVCLQIESTPISIPTSWGDPYPIDVGGTLAIRERDIEGLTIALQKIKCGESSAEKELFTINKKGQTVTVFDVYGMEPGFCLENYSPVNLKDKTVSLLSEFKDAPQKPNWPLPKP